MAAELRETMHDLHDAGAIDKQPLRKFAKQVAPSCVDEQSNEMGTSESCPEPQLHYDEWLSGKVKNTQVRVAAGTTQMHGHGDAMSLLKRRLKARVRGAD